jgi:hypothetical protein
MRHSVNGGHAPNYAAGQVGTRTWAIFEQVKWTSTHVISSICCAVISDSGTEATAAAQADASSIRPRNKTIITFNTTPELRSSRDNSNVHDYLLQREN